MVCVIMKAIMQENFPEIMPETKNKTFVLVSAILLLVIAVIIAVFFNKNQANKDVNKETEQEMAVQQETEVASDAQSNEPEGNLLFADLIAQKEGSYRCQIENEEGFYIYYFDNERLAVEVKVTNSHTKTIVDEEFTYSWNVDEKVGTKISNQEDTLVNEIDQEEMSDEEMMEELPEEDLLPAEDVGPFDPADFVCEAWQVEESIFTPPSDVMFQDLSQLQEQMMDFVQ